MEVILCTAPEWCASCRKFEPIFSEVAKEEQSSKMKFKVLDVEKNVEFTEKYVVRNVPTTLFIENGKEYERISGTMTKQQFKEVVRKWK